jgi:hypothetical protein
MRNSNRVSNILFKEKTLIVKTFLLEEERVKILNFIEKDQENKLLNINDNLFLTERTEWFYHENENFKPFFYDIVYNQILSAVENIIFQYTDKSKGNNGLIIDYGIDVYNCWFSKFKKGGYTMPHVHFESYGNFAFSCYLKLPSLRSSLTFCNSDNTDIQNIEVREGDILIFPGHLQHWSFDVEEDRSLLSGNFLLTANREKECQCEGCLSKNK